MRNTESMSSAQEVVRHTLEREKNSPPFSYPIDAFLYTTLRTLRGYLKNQPELLHCKDSDFACGATQYLIKELEESPHYFEAVGELEALAYQLGGTPHALRFLYALELYIYYTEEQLKYSENRICEFLQQLTQEELSSLAPCLNEFLKEVPVDESRLREDFLSCFFCNDSASQVTTLDALEIKDTEHKALLNTKLFSALMRPLTRLQPQFAYELAQVFNASENQALRQEAETILTPIQTNWRINLIPSYDDWYLCEHSEEKLLDALSEQGCMACMDAAQRPLMLLKLKGKPSALVLQTFKTVDGTLLPAGTWISPVSPTTRERIYTAFDTKYQKISPPLFYGTWAYMRSVTPESLEKNGVLVTLSDIAAVLNKRSRYIGQRPSFSPDRQAYRMKHKEEMEA